MRFRSADHLDNGVDLVDSLEEAHHNLESGLLQVQLVAELGLQAIHSPLEPFLANLNWAELDGLETVNNQRLCRILSVKVGVRVELPSQESRVDTGLRNNSDTVSGEIRLINNFGDPIKLPLFECVFDLLPDLLGVGGRWQVGEGQCRPVLGAAGPFLGGHLHAGATPDRPAAGLTVGLQLLIAYDIAAGGEVRDQGLAGLSQVGGFGTCFTSQLGGLHHRPQAVRGQACGETHSDTGVPI